ncbi:hypothetical protein V8D89_000945 [Ganoderma adspersum]
MKPATLAPLFSLSQGVVAPVAVPQKPLALGGISRNRASAPLRDTHFGFTLPSRHDIAQCARAELKWENGTRKFLQFTLVVIAPPRPLYVGTHDEDFPVCQPRIGYVAFGPKGGDLIQYYEVYGLRSDTYPLVVCGPSYGTLQANISEGEGMESKLWYTIMPSSDSHCLD